MHNLPIRIASLICLLAMGGAAAAAANDGAIQLPEPGILELGVIGAIAAVIASRGRRRK